MATKAMTGPVFHVGSPVQVNAFGCWYPGTVTSVGPKRYQVKFTTGGATKTRPFVPSCVVPAGTFRGFCRGQPGPGSPEALAAVELIATEEGQGLQ